jgi:hypothetical protein
MKKVIPAIGVAASLVAAPAFASTDPAPANQTSAAAKETTADTLRPTEAFSLAIGDMAKLVEKRTHVANDFHDKPPPGLPKFGESKGPSFVNFKSTPKNTKPQKGSEVDSIFKRYKPT